MRLPARKDGRVSGGQLAIGDARPILYGTSALNVREADRCEVDWMIRRHYLGKWPGVTVSTLGMFREANPVGVIVFALPPAETFVRYGGLTWELARLWIADSEPRNSESWFIARAVRYVRRHHRDVAALVSYADPAAGHSGVIYRASNWIEDGMTDEGRKTPRFDYRALGKTFSRRAHVPQGVELERVPRVSKHRFVYRVRGARLQPHGSRPDSTGTIGVGVAVQVYDPFGTAPSEPNTARAAA